LSRSPGRKLGPSLSRLRKIRFPHLGVVYSALLFYYLAQLLLLLGHLVLLVIEIFRSHPPWNHGLVAWLAFMSVLILFLCTFRFYCYCLRHGIVWKEGAPYALAQASEVRKETKESIGKLV